MNAIEQYQNALEINKKVIAECLPGADIFDNEEWKSLQNFFYMEICQPVLEKYLGRISFLVATAQFDEYEIDNLLNCESLIKIYPNFVAATGFDKVRMLKADPMEFWHILKTAAKNYGFTFSEEMKELNRSADIETYQNNLAKYGEF